MVGLNCIFLSLWIHRSHFGRSRGFMIRTSKCLKRYPKLLSQPVWTLIVCSVIFLYLIMYLFHVTNCESLEASEDNLYAKQSESSPFLTTPFISVPLILMIYWLMLVVKMGQQTIVARTVFQWYFAENKSTLFHPISTSLLSTLRYNLGSIASCSFSGWLQFETAIFLAGRFLKSGRVSDRNMLPLLTSLKSYLSPIAPVSLGVYGFVRPTNICGDPFFDVTVFDRLKMPHFEAKRLNRQQENKPESLLNLNKVIQDVHSSSKWCIRSCWISFTCFSIPVFLMLEDIKYDLGFIKPIPPIIAFLLAFFICDIWFGVVSAIFDTLAICLYEDLDCNDGKEKLFYGSRGFIYRITGARVLLTETKAGLRYTEKLQQEREKQKSRQEYLKIAEARVRNKRRMKTKKPKQFKKNSSGISDRVRSYNLVQHEAGGLSQVTAKIKEQLGSNSNTFLSEPKDSNIALSSYHSSQKDDGSHACDFEDLERKRMLCSSIQATIAKHAADKKVLNTTSEDSLPQSSPSISILELESQKQPSSASKSKKKAHDKTAQRTKKKRIKDKSDQKEDNDNSDPNQKTQRQDKDMSHQNENNDFAIQSNPLDVFDVNEQGSIYAGFLPEKISDNLQTNNQAAVDENTKKTEAKKKYSTSTEPSIPTTADYEQSIWDDEMNF